MPEGSARVHDPKVVEDIGRRGTTEMGEKGWGQAKGQLIPTSEMLIEDVDDFDAVISERSTIPNPESQW